jgi:single-stranded DNA-binding protein
MIYINKAEVFGNVAAPPEFSKTMEGKPKVTFTLVTHGYFTDENGTPGSYSEFHHIAGYHKLTEVVRLLDLNAGSRVYVIGEMRTTTYFCDTDNCKKHIRELKIHRIELDRPNV